MAKRVFLSSVFLMSCFVFVLSYSVPVFAQEEAGFEAARFVVCEGVSDREPVGLTSTFPESTEKVYAFLEARNISADTTVDIVWSHEGVVMDSVSLRLGAGSRWRTYANKTVTGQAGNWRAELKAADGSTVASADFKVE